MSDKKELLLETLASAIKEKRGNISINRLSLESDVSKSILSMIEKAKRDPQLSTIFKIAEALYMKPSELLCLVEQKLGEDFSLIDN